MGCKQCVIIIIRKEVINLATVHNVNNKNYTIFEPNDILYIIEKECSPELANVLRELITDLKEKADYDTNYVKEKLNTDLDCYESELEEYSNMCSEIRDTVEQLSNYIYDSKKLDRSHILEKLSDIRLEMDNVN